MSDVTQRVIMRTLTLLVVLAAVAAAAAVYLRSDRSDSAAPIAEKSLAQRVPGAVLPSIAADVLPTIAADAPTPSVQALAAKLEPLIGAKALGKSVSIDILDPQTGKHLLTRSQNTPRTPASTQKLLTSAAALTALGADTTLPTRIVSDDATRVVLVGGGDVLLGNGKSDPDAVDGRAGLATLASETATALKASGSSKVKVTLDDRLFDGPLTAAGWSPSDVGNGFVAPVQALEINAGRLTSEDYAPRASDPAMAAAKVFARALDKAGIRVDGAVKRGPAPGGAPILAEVASAPIGDQVEFALTHSDNTVAEALGRLVAVKTGGGASFDDVGPAVLTQVQKLGVPVNGARMLDGSGLADGSRIPPTTLTAVLAKATAADAPQLRPMLSGLPVAAVSGTLLERFGGSNQRAATGVVRAKTGTLIGVSSLAGTVVDADGRLLVFAAMADQVPSTGTARLALDKLATKLAACGCR